MKCMDCGATDPTPGCTRCEPCALALADDYLVQGPRFQAAVRAEVARQFVDMFSGILGRPATADDLASLATLPS